MNWFRGRLVSPLTKGMSLFNKDRLFWRHLRRSELIDFMPLKPILSGFVTISYISEVVCEINRDQEIYRTKGCIVIAGVRLYMD